MEGNRKYSMRDAPNNVQSFDSKERQEKLNVCNEKRASKFRNGTQG